MIVNSVIQSNISFLFQSITMDNILVIKLYEKTLIEILK